MKFTVFVAFLFSIGWMSVEVAGTGRPVECCNEVKNTRIPVENIMQYDIQEITSLCYVRAIRFHTKKNKVICSDPDNTWAKNAMKKIDERKKKPSLKPITCYTSTTNVIPTTATTATETETSTSTTVTPAVMTIKTSEMTSTTVPTTVTAVKTSTLETTISKTTTLRPSVSKEKPESTATTCGTGETTAPPTVTTTTAAATTTTSTTTTSVTKTTKKLPKMLIRLKGKSKKLLRKIQMGTRLKTTRRPNKT